MLEELISIHQEVMNTTPTSVERYLYAQINWSSKSLCVLGDRGVGKTTLLCQDLLKRYKTPDKALYLSADHIHVISYGLFNIAKLFFDYGGEALYIDEVHKYPQWSIEIKNILDTYKKCQIIFSGSSSLDLNKSKADLSRRAVYHKLKGLSFREYLLLTHQIEFPSYTLHDIISNHVAIASELSSFPVLKHFKHYLAHGYYPFFLEGLDDYTSKLYNVIEKVLFEDVATIYNLKQTTLPILKKILWLVATSNGLIPNIDKMSKNLAVSREMIYNCLEYLNSSGLLSMLFFSGKGNSLIRKPGKIYINNTNLLNSIHSSLKLDSEIGGARETFFVNQLNGIHKTSLHDKGDFLVDDKWTFEIGGRGKNSKQISGLKNAYLAVDEVKIGAFNKIPLYLFGFLY